ncbi:zf-BED domain-containing protein [Tanacetum coccineum]
MELAASKKRKLFSVDGDEELLESDDRPRHTDTFVSKKGKVQSTLNKIYKKDERDKVCQQIARFFYTSALSFNCVKNPEFKKMIQMVGDYGRGLDPPSYHEMRVTYLQKEVDYTKALLEDYKNEWKKTALKEEENMLSFKVDTIMQQIIRAVLGEILLIKMRTIYWTPCAAHCIDLMLEDFEKKIEEHKVTIAKGKKITSFRYEPIFNIIDERWDNQLNRPLHVAGYFLNPRMQYSSDFKCDTGSLKANLYMCIEKMCGNEDLANEIDCQLDMFKNKKGHLFNLNTARLNIHKKTLVDWWDSFGDDTPELKRFAIRVHSKRRNCLHQQKMNDLVYVMYNLKLSGREEKKMKETAAAIDQLEALDFENVESDDEWITEEESTQSQAHDGGGDNVFLERALRSQFG